MRAIVVTPGEAGSGRLEEVPDPVPGPNEALVEVLEVGVCGTDLEILGGHYGTAPPGDDYLIIGHENFGRVLEAPESSAFKRRRPRRLRGAPTRPGAVRCVRRRTPGPVHQRRLPRAWHQRHPRFHGRALRRGAGPSRAGAARGRARRRPHRAAVGRREGRQRGHRHPAPPPVGTPRGGRHRRRPDRADGDVPAALPGLGRLDGRPGARATAPRRSWSRPSAPST